VESQIGRLSLTSARTAMVRLADSPAESDVNHAFARANLELELIDGVVYDRNSVAVELDVDDAPSRRGLRSWAVARTWRGSGTPM
jgi:hypothetical protein